MAGLESYLPYDSYGMRLLAGALQQQSQTLTTGSSEIDGAAGGMTFDGPAGDRIRATLKSSSAQLSRTAQETDSAARQLLTAAQQVDDQNAAIQRHNQHVLDAMTPIERKLVLENM
jgi:hypothetical protein